MANVGIRLDLRQSQQLVMTPQLQQAIKLLQMSNMELSEFVAEEIERNPLLEIGAQDSGQESTQEGERAQANGAAGSEEAAPREGLDATFDDKRVAKAEETFDTGLENVYADQATADVAPGDAGGNWSSVGAGGSNSFEGGDYDFESNATREKTLREHMLEQLKFSSAGGVVKLIAADLVEYVDDAGYLKVDIRETAERLGADPDEVSDAIKIIQGMEPSGLGAGSLAECLALQLMDKNRYDPVMQTLLDNLELLAKRDVKALSALCDLEPEELAEMVAEIRELNPKPGSLFSSEHTQVVIPDVFVRQNNFGGWSVELNTDNLPRVLINNRYSAQIDSKGKDADAVKTYLNDCLQNANWLVKSLDQRARTILKVSSEIVRQQDAFFVHGVRELRPLNLKAVAEAINMHESTVSRVTSNKFMSTNRGIFELKFFFTASIAAMDGGEAYSAEAIRHRVKKLIDDESPNSILSDDRIVATLRGEGIDIARRTVAKYRESMKIPSSVQRRREKSGIL